MTAFLGGSPGPGELLVVFLAVLLLFGPRRLPGIARTLGRMMTRWRRAAREFQEALLSADREADAPPDKEDRPDDRPLAG